MERKIKGRLENSTFQDFDAYLGLSELRETVSILFLFLFKYFGHADLLFKCAASNLLHVPLKRIHTCAVTQLNVEIVLNYVAVCT